MHSVVSDSLWPHGLQPTKLLLPGFSKKWKRNQKHLIPIDTHRPTGIIIAKWNEQEDLRPFNNLCFLTNILLDFCDTNSTCPASSLATKFLHSWWCFFYLSYKCWIFFPHCFVRFSFNSHSICYTLKRLSIAIAARDVSQK